MIRYCGSIFCSVGILIKCKKYVGNGGFFVYYDGLFDLGLYICMAQCFNVDVFLDIQVVIFFYFDGVVVEVIVQWVVNCFFGLFIIVSVNEVFEYLIIQEWGIL